MLIEFIGSNDKLSLSVRGLLILFYVTEYIGADKVMVTGRLTIPGGSSLAPVVGLFLTR